MPRNNAGIPATVINLENSKGVTRTGKKTAKQPVRVPRVVTAKAKRGLSGTDRRIYDSVFNAVQPRADAIEEMTIAYESLTLKAR